MDVELYTPSSVITVRRDMFEVGDEVRTTTTPLSRGFVTAIHDGWLDVTTDEEGEVGFPRPGVNMLSFNWQINIFYREAEHTTNPKTNRVLDAMKKSQIDMYSRWRERCCVVISGPYKGHRGLVKTTHPDGRIGVQLDTCLSQTTEFKFDSILVQESVLPQSLLISV